MTDVPRHPIVWDPTVDLALEEERALIASLGGYTLEIAGARLVTHERIPVPRFNFIQEVRVAGGRQSAFFERALDHYFQRALRPTVRIEDPPADHLDRGLRAFGFVPRPEPHVLLLGAAPGASGPPSEVPVRAASPDEVDGVVAFWATEREREELRRSVEVSWRSPNPDERLGAVVAERNGRPIAAALVHQYRGVAGIHAVATQAASRGQGAATALVRFALASVLPPRMPVAMHAESRRLADRLGTLGFGRVRTYRAYDLPRSAELALPPVGPPGPPRWRPPRRPAPVRD